MTAHNTLETGSVDTRTSRVLGIGALAGGFATTLFMVVHQLLIMNIWTMFLPMVVSGVVCGLAIAWSYTKVSESWSTASWFGLNAAYLGSLLALGAVSLAVFSPEWTFAELNVPDPPLGDLFSRAAPLMIAFSIVGALIIWRGLGGSRSLFASILLAETLLVLLIGHNVAIIGLVDTTAEGQSLVWLMFALIALLGVAYAAVAEGLHQMLSQRTLVAWSPNPRR